MNPGGCASISSGSNSKVPTFFSTSPFSVFGSALSPLGKAGEAQPKAGHAAPVRPQTQAQADPTGKSNRAVPFIAPVQISNASARRRDGTGLALHGRRASSNADPLLL
jgi:hypothetical protein